MIKANSEVTLFPKISEIILIEMAQQTIDNKVPANVVMSGSDE